jgi:putative ABC transport system permease protein
LAAAAAAAAGAEARRRELALYVLLGARPAQLVALLLGEAALIGLGAGLGGALLARALWAGLRGAAISGPGLGLPPGAGPLIEPAVAFAFALLSAAAALPVAWAAARGRAQDELGAAG